MDAHPPGIPASPPSRDDSLSPEVRAARDAFPTGLDQPEGGYRFSLDPLLLAAFVRPRKDVRIADLGTGCGVAASATLLRHSGPRDATGLDIDPAMTAAAATNAVRLGLSERFQVRTLDIRSIRDHLPPESFGLALANPPYRRLGTGLPCAGSDRTRARFEAEAELVDFLVAASWLLANRGSLAVVFPAARLGELMVESVRVRLTPKRLRLVHSRLDEPARLVLLESIKNGGDGLMAEPPLVLYNGRGPDTRLSPQALAFCPFLEGNP